MRAALFVDFDNVFSGLSNLDDGTAERFAANPGRWLAVLEAGTLSGDGRPRRFLQRACYLNPSRYADHRAAFTHAGFRVIDCPSLTQRGKSSADIHLVLDCVDTLRSEVPHTEFILMSADADFTPLVHRLRGADRRVGVGVAGQSSAAYRSSADFVFTVDGLLRAAAMTTAERSTSCTPGRPRIANTRPVRSSPVEAVRAQLRAAETPLPGAAVAAQARLVDPTLVATRWEGAGSFRNWLQQHCPEVEWSGHPPFVWERGRFSPADVAGETEPTTDLIDQLTAVTDVPRLEERQYRHVLRSLAGQSGAGFQRAESAKRVRDECRGLEVGRGAVNFVINGILYSGLDLKQPQQVEAIASAWADNVIGLASGAGLVLDAPKRARLIEWSSGGLRQIG